MRKGGAKPSPCSCHRVTHCHTYTTVLVSIPDGSLSLRNLLPWPWALEIWMFLSIFHFVLCQAWQVSQGRSRVLMSFSGVSLSGGPTPILEETAPSGGRKSLCPGEERKYQLVINCWRSHACGQCPLFSLMALTQLQLRRRRSFRFATVSYRKVQSRPVNRY